MGTGRDGGIGQSPDGSGIGSFGVAGRWQNAHSFTPMHPNVIRRFLTFPLSLVVASATALAQPAPTEPKAGSVQGWAVNDAGAPLADVTVHIYGTTMAGENTRFETPTKADGKYRQRVPDGIYGVRADCAHRWNGTTYTMPLHPTDGVTARRHDSEEGIAKDFIWKIAGLRPGETPGEPGTHNEPGKYYGGSLQVSIYAEGFASGPAFPDGTTLVATLRPRGTLFDGSAGKPVTFKRTFGGEVRTSSNWYPSDIPLGVYDLTVAVEGGRRLTVRKSLDRDQAYHPSVQVDVLPDPSSGRALPIQIMVKP